VYTDFSLQVRIYCNSAGRTASKTGRQNIPAAAVGLLFYCRMLWRIGPTIPVSFFLFGWRKSRFGEDLCFQNSMFFLISV
jgi:hypothetical protein